MTKGPRKVKLVIVVNKKDPPTFKTLTPTSRTQLKQQLMREHAQEQLRREAAEARSPGTPQRERDAPPAPAALRVPPQVLQVRTALENPTRYHVIQKQQSQVRQYLSESFQPRQECPPRTLPAPEPPAQAPSPDCDFASGSGALSPEMCSVTTSNSETDDFLDDILSLESGGAMGDLDLSGELSGGIKRESLPLSDAEMHAMAKDRQKKDNHNMIERRRRFNINDRIKELGALLPKTDDPFYEVIRDVRPNKGTILKSSVDYIKCLREEVDKLKRGELRRRQTELHNRKLLLRIQELERATGPRGPPADELQWQPPREEPRYPYSAPASHRSGASPPPPPAAEAPVRIAYGSSLPAEESRLSAETALGCLQLDASMLPDMALSPPPSLLLAEDPSSALNLSQMEDLMEDDPRDGRIAQGDPMLCSSPSSGLRLDGDEAQRAAIESMLSDEGAMMDLAQGGGSLLVDSAALGLLDSSGLLGPGRSRGGRVADCFSDADMELGA